MSRWSLLNEWTVFVQKGLEHGALHEKHMVGCVTGHHIFVFHASLRGTSLGLPWHPYC